VGFLPGEDFLFDRKDKQAHLAMPVAPACLRPSKKQASLLRAPGPTAFLDRKDKQAGPMRLFIVFSPTGKTSKPTATLQANTTGARNVAVGQGSSFPQKRQASELPWDRAAASFLSEKTSKQLSTGYPQVIQ